LIRKTSRKLKVSAQVKVNGDEIILFAPPGASWFNRSALTQGVVFAAFCYPVDKFKKKFFYFM
jgi:hypothetical protein